MYRQLARVVILVAQGSLYVYDRIERPALAHPLVDGLARPLAYRRPRAGKKGLVLERRQGRAEDLDAGCPGAHRKLFEARDHLVGGDLFLGLRPTVAQIVGAQHDDYVLDAGLSDDVAVEAAKAAV